MEGLILAGGRSLRMGTDKALLAIDGVPLLRLLAERMAGCADPAIRRIWVACGSEERVARYTEALAGFELAELRFVTDRYLGCGPLSGLHAALESMPAESWAFVMACDMPELSEPLLRRMLCAAEEAAAAGGRYPDAIHAPGEPLHAVYRTDAAERVRERLEAGDYRVMGLLEKLNSVRVEPKDEELAAFGNLNQPEVYEAYLRRFR